METHTVEVVLGQKSVNPRTGKVKDPEKVHSRVFEAATGQDNPVIGSVYLNRPMSNPKNKATITVVFHD
jgi:hypothetical protein